MRYLESMTWFFTMLLAGCALPPTGSVDVPWSSEDVARDEERRPPPTLELVGPVEVLADTSVAYTLTGLAPDERVYLLAAMEEEDGPCLDGLGGLCLDLAWPPRGFATGFADSSGTARLEVRVPALIASGRDIVTQAVLVRGFGGVDSTKSNVWRSSVTDELSDTSDTADACEDTGAVIEALEPSEDDGWAWGVPVDFAVSDAVLDFDHHHATVGVSESGRLMIAFDEGEAPIARVKGSVFDADNTPIATDFFVGWLADYSPGRPDVLSTADGWTLVYSTATEVLLVAFDSEGGESGRSEAGINVATGTAFYQGMPDLVQTESGLLALYVFSDETGDAQGRYYYRFVNDSLEPMGVETALSVSSLGPSPPDAARTGSGVVMVWSERFLDCAGGQAGRIYTRRFDAMGSALGAERRVDQGTLPGVPSRPVVSGSEAGGYAVAWRAQSETREGRGVRLRMFAEDGAPLTDALIVGADAPDTGTLPALEVVGNVAVIAWNETNAWGDLDVFMAAYDIRDGRRVASARRAHVTTSGVQERPALAVRAVEEGVLDVILTYENTALGSTDRQVLVHRIPLTLETGG